MNSIAIIEAVNTTSLPFHGQQILTAMAAGVAYVAMRPIVENIGIDWSGQMAKLKGQREKFGCRDISTPTKGGVQNMLCIPLRKLNGWLFSINPAKVREDIRDRLVRYQEECFTALHDYWTKGAAVRKPETTVDDRTPLRGIVNRIMGKYGMTYQAVYKLVHKEFGVKHIDELSAKQTSEAIEYLAGKVIEGDFIPASLPLPIGKQFTDDELCHLAWLWDASNRMQDFAKDIYPALYALKSGHSGTCKDYSVEFRWTIEQARKAIMEASAHIIHDPLRGDNWSRVMPRLKGTTQ